MGVLYGGSLEHGRRVWVGCASSPQPRCQPRPASPSAGGRCSRPGLAPGSPWGSPRGEGREEVRGEVQRAWRRARQDLAQDFLAQDFLAQDFLAQDFKAQDPADHTDLRRLATQAAADTAAAGSTRNPPTRATRVPGCHHTLRPCALPNGSASQQDGRFINRSRVRSST